VTQLSDFYSNFITLASILGMLLQVCCPGKPTYIMALLPILEYPDPRLRTKAMPVAQVDAGIRQLINDMLETMYEAKGIGLAATQVDRHIQLIVMDLSEERNAPRVYINPAISQLSEDKEPYDEGCLSVPGFYETVERPASCERSPRSMATARPSRKRPTACWRSVFNTRWTTSAASSFVDYLSSLKRERIKKKLEKQHKHAGLSAREHASSVDQPVTDRLCWHARVCRGEPESLVATRASMRSSRSTPNRIDLQAVAANSKPARSRNWR
jgi:peptide deformylase